MLSRGAARHCAPRPVRKIMLLTKRTLALFQRPRVFLAQARFFVTVINRECSHYGIISSALGVVPPAAQREFRHVFLGAVSPVTVSPPPSSAVWPGPDAAPSATPATCPLSGFSFAAPGRRAAAGAARRIARRNGVVAPAGSPPRRLNRREPGIHRGARIRLGRLLADPMFSMGASRANSRPLYQDDTVGRAWRGGLKSRRRSGVLCGTRGHCLPAGEAMSKRTPSQELERGDRDLAELQRQLAAQACIVARLAAEGRDTALAEACGAGWKASSTLWWPTAPSSCKKPGLPRDLRRHIRRKWASRSRDVHVGPGMPAHVRSLRPAHHSSESSGGPPNILDCLRSTGDALTFGCRRAPSPYCGGGVDCNATSGSTLSCCDLWGWDYAHLTVGRLSQDVGG